MSKIEIYCFGHYDRSSKVRWLAHHLELNVIDHLVELGANRQPQYRELNPFASIPTVKFNDETLIESSAICQFIAEQFPEKALTVPAGEEDRYNFLKWLSICSETLESRLVDYMVSRQGLMPEMIQDIYHKTLVFKTRTLVEQLPTNGFVVANRFTLADIFVSYQLKLAIRSELIKFEQVSGYLKPLMAMPSASNAQFFSDLTEHLN